jgi:hypothetical protein
MAMRYRAYTTRSSDCFEAQGILPNRKLHGFLLEWVAARPGGRFVRFVVAKVRFPALSSMRSTIWPILTTSAALILSVTRINANFVLGLKASEFSTLGWPSYGCFNFVVLNFHAFLPIAKSFWVHDFGRIV